MRIITAYMVGILIGWAICGVAFLCYVLYPHVRALVDWVFDSIGGAK